MGISWVHILIFAVIAVLLFGGRGKISDLMGDVAKGIKSFRQGLSDNDDDARRISEHRDDVAAKKDQ